MSGEGKRLPVVAGWKDRALKAEAEVERLGELFKVTEAWGNDGWAWLDDALKALGVETVFDIPASDEEQKSLPDEPWDQSRGVEDGF